MTTKRFKTAIQRAGSSAYPAGNDNALFAASIQPEAIRGDGRSAAGTGFLRRFMLYADFSKASESLDAGDRIKCLGASYRIERIETRLLSGKPVYREGVLIMEEDLPSKA